VRVILAMSGGVDSSTAATVLLDEGHQVTGVFLRNGVEPGPLAGTGRQGCCSVGDASDAARVADVLGIPFYALDFSRDFDSIVGAFADAYAGGRTPNPCVACNRDLKFGKLLRFADALGADAVATGHYAATERRGGRVALRIPRDRAKDQTYVLFPLSQEQLARTVFPLAGMTKDETRRRAAARGLPVAEKPESMEICFVPGGDYRAVLAERRPDALRAGEIVDQGTGVVVGRHGGVGTVTIGQRRGVGVVGPEPVYVTAIDAESNRVFVGGPDRLLRRAVVVEAWNAVSAESPPAGAGLRGFAKVRRNHEPAAATARADGDGRVRVEFDEPVRAPAPGQALVLYDADGCVLGGGWIAAAPL
jgi:tRNA-specific 2-thiouridylase